MLWCRLRQVRDFRFQVFRISNGGETRSRSAGRPGPQQMVQNPSQYRPGPTCCGLGRLPGRPALRNAAGRCRSSPTINHARSHFRPVQVFDRGLVRVQIRILCIQLHFKPVRSPSPGMVSWWRSPFWLGSGLPAVAACERDSAPKRS